MMFVPFLTLIIVIPVTFLAIGPVMNGLSNALAGGTQALWGFSPVIAGVIMGAFWQVIVIFGLHYASIPILINNIATLGTDPVNAVLGMTVMALAGSGFGYALKQKKKEAKAEGLSCAFVGGGIAGGFLAASGAAMQGFGNGGIFQTFMMISPTDPINVVWFGMSSAVAFAVSGVLCFFVTKADEA